jgi:hypothetical protein
MALLESFRVMALSPLGSDEPLGFDPPRILMSAASAMSPLPVAELIKDDIKSN